MIESTPYGEAAAFGWLRRHGPRSAASYAAVLCSLMALLALVMHLWHPGSLIAFTDLYPLPHPWRFLTRVFLAWNDFGSYFGSLFPTPAMGPYLALDAAFTWLFGPSLAQPVLIWLGLAASWIGMYVLANYLGCRLVAAALAAWLYVLSPFMQLSLGVFQPLDWMLAVLPWLAYVAVRAAREPTKRPEARFLLLVFAGGIFPAIAFTLQVGYGLIVAMVVVLIAAFATIRERRQFARWVLSTVALMSVTTLWWVVALVVPYLTNPITRSSDPASVAFVFARASLLNELRFAPLWTWKYPTYYPFATSYDANIASYAAGFLPFALLIAGIIVARGGFRTYIRIFGLAGLFFLFVAKAIHPPLVWLYEIVHHLPGFFLFEEPAPLIGAASFFFCISSAVAVEELCRRFVRDLPLAIAAGLLAVTGVAAYGAWPMLTGDLFHGSNEYSASDYIRIPNYWEEIRRYLDNQRVAGGVLILPRDTFYQAAYSWGYTGVDIFPQLVLDRRTLNPGVTIGYIDDTRSASISRRIVALFAHESISTASYLRSIGIRYVVFRRDVAIPGPFNINEEQVARALPLAKRIEFGKLTLLDIGGDVRSGFGEYDGWIAGDYSSGRDPQVDAGALLRLSSMASYVPRVDDGASGALLRSGVVEHEVVTHGREAPSILPGGGVSARALVWTGRESTRVSLPGGSGARLTLASDGTAREMPAASFALSMLPSSQGLTAFPLPIVASVKGSLSQRGFAEYTLVNPSASRVRMNLRIAVRDSRATRYMLKVDGERLSVLNDSSNQVKWLTFRGFTLRPGSNQLAISAHTVKRGASPTGRGLAMAVTATTLVGSLALEPGGSRQRGVASGVRPGVLVPIWTRAELDPQLRINFARDVRGEVGATVIADVGGRRYACPTSLQNGVALSLVEAVGACFDAESLARDFRIDHVVFESVVFPNSDLGSIPEGTATVSRRSVWRPRPLLHWTVSSATPDALAHRVGGFVTLAVPDRTRHSPEFDTSIVAMIALVRPEPRTSSLSIDVEGAKLTEPPSELVRFSTGQLRVFATETGLSVYSFPPLPQVGRGSETLPIRLIFSAREGETESFPFNIWSAREAPSPIVEVGADRLTPSTKDRTDSSFILDASPTRRLILVPEDARITIASLGPVARPKVRELPVRSWVRSPWLAALDVRKGLVVDAQSFSPSWLAIEVGHGVFFPAHRIVDGWKNGWAVLEGRLIVVNMVVILQFVGMLVAALLAIRSALGLFSRDS